MCQCCSATACFDCSLSLRRRDFIKHYGTAAAAGLLVPRLAMAGEAHRERARVALVFLADASGKESWPYPNFDSDNRHREIINLLDKGCPQTKFVPIVVGKPDDVEKANALKDEVDGYLVYTTTLTWPFTDTIVQVGKLGKPILVVDEFLGGSGVFLIGYSRLRRLGIPVAAVSSTQPSDLVTVARVFAEVKKQNLTPESFAKRCEVVYRHTFVPISQMKCMEDKVPLTDIGECVKRLKESRFLIVGTGQPGEEEHFLGAKGIYVGFDEFQTFYDKMDRDEASEWGRRWSTEAEKVIDAKPEWINKAGAVYLAMLALMKKYSTDSITMNCLGGFAGGQLPAYPCLGFMQILNDGGQGVCEAKPDDSISTLMGRILTGRAGYVSDPALDTSKYQVVYAHCMALTRVFGPKGPANRYHIRTLHNRDPRGCCAQSFLPEGYMTTTFRTNIKKKKMVIHQAKAVGNLDADRGCRTQLVGEVRGDIGKLFNQWDLFGWHRVTVYGDVKEPIIEFAKALGLEVVEEA
ncbi:MAG: hypothetical protein JSV03_11100 [Planctomycetota bacterium]|nr:MAG: hypothetical protein JSV03_11100 [Planctomycetota bacterium]